MADSRLTTELKLLLSQSMRANVRFNIKCWFFGISVSDAVPLAGYINGVEYMKAVENTLVVLSIGPIGFNFWFGPEPKDVL